MTNSMNGLLFIIAAALGAIAISWMAMDFAGVSGRRFMAIEKASDQLANPKRCTGWLGGGFLGYVDV